MAKEKSKKAVELEESIELTEVETETSEPTNTFADTIDLTPKVAATVSMAIAQAADRLARDKANFPQL